MALDFFEEAWILTRPHSNKHDPPVLLVKWYDFTKWLLERVDNFPKNQRFIFGTRLADHVLEVMELLVEASYSRQKTELLAKVNRKIEWCGG